MLYETTNFLASTTHQMDVSPWLPFAQVKVPKFLSAISAAGHTHKVLNNV